MDPWALDHLGGLTLMGPYLPLDLGSEDEYARRVIDRRKA